MYNFFFKEKKLNITQIIVKYVNRSKFQETDICHYIPINFIMNYCQRFYSANVFLCLLLCHSSSTQNVNRIRFLFIAFNFTCGH